MDRVAPTAATPTAEAADAAASAAPLRLCELELQQPHLLPKRQHLPRRHRVC